MLGDSTPVYPLPITMQKWAHKDTSAVAPGPDPSARPQGPEAGKSAAGCSPHGPASSAPPLSTPKSERVCLVDKSGSRTEAASLLREEGPTRGDQLRQVRQNDQSTGRVLGSEKNEKYL